MSGFLVNSKNEKWFVKQVKLGKIKIKKNGKVFNPKTGRYIGAIGSGRYIKISMKDMKRNKIRSIQVHRLLWIIYKGIIPYGKEINHKDGIKTNNKLSNLEVVSPTRNKQHAKETGLLGSCKGEKNSQSKFKDSTILKLRKKFRENKINLNYIINKYKVSRFTASSIITGYTYRHVPLALKMTIPEWYAKKKF